VTTIREKRPGLWEVRVFAGRDAAGSPVQVSKTVRGTKKDAQRLAAQLTLRPAPSAGRRTVAELLDEYVKHKEPTWSIQTRANNRGRLKAILSDAISKMAVARVAVRDVDAWVLRMRKAGVGDAARLNRHAFLKAAFEQAVRWEWITHNAVKAARPKSRKVPPRDAMTPEEVQAVIAAATAIDPAAGVALRLAAAAGARRAEVAALQWKNFREGAVIIDHQITADRSCAPDDPNRYVHAPTKTANRRLVSLDDRTWRLVAELKLQRQAATPWLFGVDERTPAPDRLGWWWTRARRLSGIDPKWRLHDLRHFSATQSIAGGHDVRTVAARLGHADASMTMRVYAHAVAGRDRLVAETMANVLGS
jgi:integrase